MINLDYSTLYQALLFLFLWLILSKLLFRPYLKLLEEREHRTSGTLEEASALTQQGEKLKAEYEARMAEAQAAGAAARETIVKEARAEREKILAEARQEAVRTLEQARRELQAQIERERQVASSEAEVIARQMAAKILGRTIT